MYHGWSDQAQLRFELVPLVCGHVVHQIDTSHVASCCGQHATQGVADTPGCLSPAAVRAGF